MVCLETAALVVWGSLGAWSAPWSGSGISVGERSVTILRLPGQVRASLSLRLRGNLGSSVAGTVAASSNPLLKLPETMSTKIPNQPHKAVLGTAVGTTVLIAVGAFILSFSALTDLAERSGIQAQLAWIWPIIVDGMIVAATVAIVALNGHSRRAMVYPWTLLFFGAIVSTAANSVHAILRVSDLNSGIPAVVSALVAAMPPVVLLAITHLTVHMYQKRAEVAELLRDLVVLEQTEIVSEPRENASLLFTQTETPEAFSVAAPVASTADEVDPLDADAPIDELHAREFHEDSQEVLVPLYEEMVQAHSPGTSTDESQLKEPVTA